MSVRHDFNGDIVPYSVQKTVVQAAWHRCLSFINWDKCFWQCLGAVSIWGERSPHCHSLLTFYFSFLFCICVMCLSSLPVQWFLSSSTWYRTRSTTVVKGKSNWPLVLEYRDRTEQTERIHNLDDRTTGRWLR